MDPASFSIFNRLTEKQFEKLSKHFNILTFGANANIYQQTDTTKYVYGVMEGMVKTGIMLDEKKN
jgi:hypothetical protein